MNWPLGNETREARCEGLWSCIKCSSCATTLFVFLVTATWARFITANFFGLFWQGRIQRSFQIRNVFRFVGLKANDELPTMQITLLCNILPSFLGSDLNNYRIFLGSKFCHNLYPLVRPDFSFHRREASKRSAAGCASACKRRLCLDTRIRSRLYIVQTRFQLMKASKLAAASRKRPPFFTPDHPISTTVRAE